MIKEKRGYISQNQFEPVCAMGVLTLEKERVRSVKENGHLGRSLKNVPSQAAHGPQGPRYGKKGRLLCCIETDGTSSSKTKWIYRGKMGSWGVKTLGKEKLNWKNVSVASRRQVREVGD